MATSRSRKTEPSEFSFEQALARLETIVEEMEAGQDLEQLMAHFEEGTRLVKLCNDKLNEVEKKVEKLLEKGDGAEPFAPESESGANKSADGASNA